MKGQFKQKIERLEKSGTAAVIAVGQGGDLYRTHNGLTKTREELQKMEQAGREIVFIEGDYRGL